jgi:hypothetical protein
MTVAITQIIGGMAAAAAVFGAYWLFVRPKLLRWGATDEEIREKLPGDEFAPPQPKLNATHAITIHAPVSEVWPWLVQIGQNRGGFYSYAWLENLCGAHMRNADRIVPEWQDLKVGDIVWLHPKDEFLPVTAIEPGRALVLGMSWAFVLRPIDEHTTRFIIRLRMGYTQDLGNVILNFLAYRVFFEPANFVMERKMMLGIKQRAEASTKQRRGV